MKRKKNRAPALNIMTLKFFARYFNFPLKDLKWGIVEEHQGKEIDLTCAVLEKSRLLYIDIASGEIKHCVNISNRKFNLILCEVQEFEDKFHFVSEGYRVSLMKKGIAEAYANKVFSEDTIKYLLGAFAEV